jgi:SAM-dependent methyltransferase
MAQPPVCDYEGSDYQERFWARGGREYEDRAEAIALRRLLPQGGERLLEVGAGAGRHTPRYRGFRQVVLLDYARSQLERARARLGDEGYLYVAADVYRMPFAPGLFDAATMIRTLHHMVEPQRALGCVRQVLRPGATFILEFANKRNLKAILRWLARGQRWNPFDLAPVEFAPLNFDFHPKAVEGWLQAERFVLQRRLTVSHFRVGLLKRLVPAALLAAMDGLLQPTGRWWQLTPSVFLAARAVGEPAAAEPGVFWRCPACGSLVLAREAQGLSCGRCGRLWPSREGIYDFKEPLKG